jgi:hypothetical protein
MVGVEAGRTATVATVGRLNIAPLIVRPRAPRGPAGLQGPSTSAVTTA